MLNEITRHAEVFPSIQPLCSPDGIEPSAGRIEAVRALIKADPSVLQTRVFNDLPIEWAARINDLEMVKALAPFYPKKRELRIDDGFDSKTPLLVFAIEMWYMDLADFLWDNGFYSSSCLNHMARLLGDTGLLGYWQRNYLKKQLLQATTRQTAIAEKIQSCIRKKRESASIERITEKIFQGEVDLDIFDNIQKVFQARRDFLTIMTSARTPSSEYRVKVCSALDRDRVILSEITPNHYVRPEDYYSILRKCIEVNSPNSTLVLNSVVKTESGREAISILDWDGKNMLNRAFEAWQPKTMLKLLLNSSSPFKDLKNFFSVYKDEMGVVASSFVIAAIVAPTSFLFSGYLCKTVLCLENDSYALFLLVNFAIGSCTFLCLKSRLDFCYESSEKFMIANLMSVELGVFVGMGLLASTIKIQTSDCNLNISF